MLEISAMSSGLTVSARWGIAGAVLLAEYVALSLRFDALSVARRGGSWNIIGQVGTFAPLGVVLATAIVLLRPATGGPSPRASGDDAPRSPARFRPAFLLLHAALFAALVALSAHVFGAAAAPPGSPALWLTAWVAVGLAGAASLFYGVLGSKVLLLPFGPLAAIVAGAAAVVAFAAGSFATELWEPMSQATLGSVTALLGAVFPGQVSQPAPLTLALGDFSVVVAPICSGFEGLGLIAILMVSYLVAFRGELRFPRALALLPLGLAGVWLGNVLRIAGLLAVGAYVDADVAHDGFHSKAGWVFFCAIALGIAWGAQRSRFFSRTARDVGFENPTAAYLMPLLGLVATALVTGMFASGLDTLYGLRIAVALALLFAYRAHYRELFARPSLFSVAMGLAVGVAWLAVPSSSGPKHAGDLGADPGFAWLAVRVAGSALVVPIVEELAFRGCLLRFIVSRDFTRVPFKTLSPLAIAASSLAFGLAHDRWLAATLAGVVYALVQIRTGRLFDAVVAHAASNACIAAWVVVTGDFSHWS